MHFADLPEWLRALLLASAWGAALAAVLALAQPLLRRALPARWRHVLWLVVLLRFVPLPLPPSVMHPHAAPGKPPAAAEGSWDPAARGQTTATLLHAAVGVARGAPGGTTPMTPASAVVAAAPARPAESAAAPATAAPMVPATPISPVTWIVTLYLAGAALLLIRFAGSLLSLRRIVNRACRINDPALLRILEDSRGTVPAPILLATADLSSPAVVGIRHPRLLMPVPLLGKLSTEEFRHIFLHELEHLRRRDVLLNYFMAALGVLHWFNPAVWLGIALARGERELACDEAAMARANPAAYGNTLLKLLEFAQHVRTLAPAVGVIETKAFLARRIRMIAHYSPRRGWLALPALALVGALFLLTGPVSRAQEAAFPGLAGDTNASFSSDASQTTPVGDVTFHGPFNPETVYVASRTLPAHDFIDISFDLLIMRSWDGAVNPKTDDQMPLDIGPDCFRLGIHGGPTLLYTTFSNTPTDPPGFRYESLHQNYPSQVPGDTYPAWNAAAAKNTLGYRYPFEGPPKPVPQDAIYKIHYVVPHKGESVTLEMEGINLQSTQDENWGIANVSIKALEGKDVKKPSEKDIAAAFGASLNKDDADLPGRFQVLINGMDDTVAWMESHVKPMPVNAAKLAVYLDTLESGNEVVEKGLSTQVALLSMGHAAEPALRDARRDLDDVRQARLDAVLSVLEVRPPAQDAAVRDWMQSPHPEMGRPSEAMRRVILATRALEIIGTPHAMALRNKLTIAGEKELEALPKAAATAHPGAMADDHFAAKLADLLGVPDTGADVLPAIADAVKTVLGNSADAGITRSATPAGRARGGPVAAISPDVDASLDNLAAALLKGPHVTLLTEKYLPLVQIGDERGGRSENPTFDVDQQLYRLNWDMWGRATMVEKTNPARAATLARAAIMLGALTDYDMYTGTLINHVTADTEEAKRLLNLPAGKFDELERLVRGRFTLEGVNYGGSLFTIDLMSAEENKPIDLEQVRKIVADFDRSFRQGVPELGMRFRTLDLTWGFLNLMKQRKSAEGEQAVRALMQTWKKDYPDPDLARWIDEALTRDGPPAQNLTGFVIDGKMMNAAEFLKFAQESKDSSIKAMTQPATKPANAPATQAKGPAGLLP